MSLTKWGFTESLPFPFLPFYFSFIFPSPHPCFILFFDAFDDILAFALYKWFLFKLASTWTEFPQWSHREKPKSSRSLAMTFAQRWEAFLWHQVKQMKLQGVGVRKSKFYTSIEFYIYHISLSKDIFQNDYSYFLWLHYVCFLSKKCKPLWVFNWCAEQVEHNVYFKLEIDKTNLMLLTGWYLNVN